MNIEVIKEDSFANEIESLIFVTDATVAQIITYAFSECVILKGNKYQIGLTVMDIDENTLKVIVQ